MSDDHSLLVDMIHDRDNHIAALTNQLHQASDSIHLLTKELHQKSAARKQQREEHSQSIKKLKEEHLEQRQKLAKFEQNVKGGGGLRVHEYASLMKSANSNQVESSYVIRLQAQLCRAMHSLGVMESQLALVKENCSSLIKFMKDDLSQMVDDRTRREIELMNGLAKVDHEHRVLQDEMEKKINEKEELLESVREEYEELGLVYDEEEVKAALEVKYLLEQMDKIVKEKERVEKELLQALLDREKQIVGLRNETNELGIRLEKLQSTGASNEVAKGRKGNSTKVVRDGDENEEESVSFCHQESHEKGDVGDEPANDEPQTDEKVQSKDTTVEEITEGKGETEESDGTNEQNEKVSTLTSQLEGATIEDDANRKQEVKAVSEADSIKKYEVDSEPVAVDGGVDASSVDENDFEISSSGNKEEGNTDKGSMLAEEDQKESPSQADSLNNDAADSEAETEQAPSEPLPSDDKDENGTETLLAPPNDDEKDNQT